MQLRRSFSYALSIYALWIPALARLAEARTTSGSAPTDRRVAGAGAGTRFARDVAARARSGHHVRALRVDADDDSVRLVVVLARGADAEELSLAFDGDGGAPTSYERRAAATPRELRVYGGEGDLFAALAEGAPESLYGECGAYFLEGAGPGVAIRPDDYYVVASSARGHGAGRLLASALRQELADGASLTGAAAAAAGPHAAEAVDLVLVGPAGSVTLHIDLDRRGRVVAVEKRVSPDAAAGWATAYAHGNELAHALARASVTRITWRTGDRAALVIGLSAGGEQALALADFVVDEEAAWACGC